MNDKMIQTGIGPMRPEAALEFFRMELSRVASEKRPRKTEVLVSILRGLSHISTPYGEQAARMFFTDHLMYPQRFSPAETQSLMRLARYAFYKQEDGYVRLRDIAYQEIGTRNPEELPYLYGDVRERMDLEGIRIRASGKGFAYDPREETCRVHIDDIELFLEAYRMVMTHPKLRERMP